MGKLISTVLLLLGLGVGVWLFVSNGKAPIDVSANLEVSSMRASFYESYGKPMDVMVVKDTDVPTELEANDVLIKVAAAALNPVDWKFINGNMKLISPYIVPSPPRIPGFDVSGTVVAMGSLVNHTSVGEEVYAMADFRYCGTLAEYVIVKGHLVTAKPKSLSFVEAASIPLVGITGYQALVDHGKVQSGEKVLVLGGSGGGGTFGVQLAKHLGAFVATTCGKRNIELLKSLGADIVIDYKSQQWWKELEGQEYDVIYDTVGGKESYDHAPAVLKAGGRFVTIVGDVARNDVSGLLTKGWSIVSRKKMFTGFDYKLFTASSRRDHLATITGMVEAGGIRAVIDKVFSLEEAPEAMAYLRQGHVTGKVVVVPGYTEPAAPKVADLKAAALAEAAAAEKRAAEAAKRAAYEAAAAERRAAEEAAVRKAQEKFAAAKRAEEEIAAAKAAEAAAGVAEAVVDAAGDAQAEAEPKKSNKTKKSRKSKRSASKA